MASISPFSIEKDQLRTALAGSIQGTWIGDGTDVFPTPNGPVSTEYVETMKLGELFEVVNPGGPGTQQTLIGIRYSTQLANKQTNAAMHQETGYWLFDAQNGSFMKAISIPRGITILAGGGFFPVSLQRTPLGVFIFASAENSSNVFGISNATFLEQVAPTTKFTSQIMVVDNALSYFESSMLTIQGQSLQHTDTATLTKQA